MDADDTNTPGPSDPSDGGFRAWFQPTGFFAPVAALLSGVTVGAFVGYGLGALAGVLLDIDVLLAGAAAGAVGGAALGLRALWLDRQKGNGWTVDPWSADD